MEMRDKDSYSAEREQGVLLSVILNNIRAKGYKHIQDTYRYFKRLICGLADSVGKIQPAYDSSPTFMRLS